MFCLQINSVDFLTDIHNQRGQASNVVARESKIGKILSQLASRMMESTQKLTEVLQTDATSASAGACAQAALEVERVQAVQRFTACNILGILTNTAVLLIDTVRVVVEVTLDGTLILGEVTSCAASLNPFFILRCIYDAFIDLPKEVRTIIDVVEDYRDAVEYFVPKVVQDIESCFNHTREQYRITVTRVIDGAEICV